MNSQWKKFLAQWARRLSADGLSAQELSELTGLSMTSVRTLLATALRQGQLQVGWKMSRRIDGYPCKVPAYQLVAEKKALRGKKR